MLPRLTNWDSYRAWNEALTHEYFNDQFAGSPVYVYPDDTRMALVARKLGINTTDPVTELAGAVRATLRLVEPDPLREHAKLTERWWRARRRKTAADTPTPPPFIALLTLFSAAAERMGGDKSIAANAYYPHLFALLGAKKQADKDRLQKSFMAHSEEIWTALNGWLNSYDGAIGLPTAYALGPRYVGLPISQAIIREADRSALRSFFNEFGLPPGTDLPAGDLRPLLQTWVDHPHSSATSRLRSMWANKSSHSRLAEVVATELSQWDGSGASNAVGGAAVGRTSLCVNVNSFPSPRLESTVVATFPGVESADTIIIEGTKGSVEMEAIQLMGNRIRPRQPVPVDLSSLLVGLMTLRVSEAESPSIRLPRRIVTLRRDQLLGYFVESDQVSLGEDYLLLVRNDRSLPEKVSALLEDHARPGWKAIDQKLRGVPEGWLLYRNVQLLSAPATPAHSDLTPLIPLIRTKLTIDGGFRFPGRVTRWSTAVPPEIRALADIDHISVALTSKWTLDDKAVDAELVSDTGVLLVDLNDLKLAEGDYEVILKCGDTEIQSMQLRLRSGATPDNAAWQRAPRLSHDLAQPLDALTARDHSEAEVDWAVDGAWATPISNEAESVSIASTPWWSKVRSDKESGMKLAIPPLDDKSCVFTGRHRFVMPPTPARQQTKRELRNQFIIGRCEGCGLIRRYPGLPPRRTETLFPDIGVQRVEKAAMPNATAVSLPDISWDVALDGLVHAGGGSVTALRSMASQVEGTALFVDNFTRGLEALAHVEIERDERFEVARWEVGLKTLAELPDRRYLVCGGWNAVELHALEAAVNAAGGTLSTETRKGLTTRIISGLSVHDIDEIPDVACGEVFLAQDAALSMAKLLPSLSDVEAALPRIPLPETKSVKWFDIERSRWQSVKNAETPGAYRLLSRFTTIDVFRTETDIDDRTAARGSVQLNKHLAAQAGGRPLLSYDRATSTVSVPLGCDLPGLFGRAAVLCSGSLPEAQTARSLLSYRDVPATVAGVLSHRLST